MIQNKDKEKQIEGNNKMYILNNILQEVKPLKLREKIYWRIVEFINKKLPEDSVVLTKEEYDDFLRQGAMIDFLKDCNKDIRKETAEAIYRQLMGHGTTYVKKWIKKNYGEEIGEKK